MKKLFLSALAITLFFTAVTFSDILGRSKNISSKNVSGIKHEDSSECFASSKNNYTVKEYGRKIAIFSEDSEKPVITIDTFVFTLPEKDRILLSKGFTVNENDLSSVIEDYTG